jgi:hypothetical protein
MSAARVSRKSFYQAIPGNALSAEQLDSAIRDFKGALRAEDFRGYRKFNERWALTCGSDHRGARKRPTRLIFCKHVKESFLNELVLPSGLPP